MSEWIRPYRALLVARARALFQYRTAALAGLATQWVFGFVMIGVLIAFYGFSTVEQPMTLRQAITYTWLGQAMLGMLPWNIDQETGESVRTGTVAYDLTRPLDLYAHWYARALAMRTAPTLLRAVPMFLIASFLLPGRYALVWPSILPVLSWAAATFGALLLSAAITVLMQTTLFWTVTGDGVTRILPHLVTLLSGMIIPLPLFPDWMQQALQLQPFAGLSALPFMLFCETLPPSALPGVLARQLLWAVAFVLLGRFVLRRGLKKLTVAGG